MNDQFRAENIIESLRFGHPPTRGVRDFSAGNEAVVAQIRERHLRKVPGGRGRIRFVSGSFGSGKTHFLAQIRESAFDSRYLVSPVTLNADETPFNRFEEVFYRIVRVISSQEIYANESYMLHAPLGEVFRRHLFRHETHTRSVVVTREAYDKACSELMADGDIDIDFRRLVCRFWETYLLDQGDSVMLEDRRGRIMQWFSGEGTIAAYRKEFGVQKLVNRSNARVLLRSLARYAMLAGYTGVVILLDEAEMSYSVMRKSELRKAHNNLLHLINGIDESPGLFFVYASTPDFFFNEKHGIGIHGALVQRVGRPQQRPPRALDRVWNLDHAQPDLADYQLAARRIRELYITAHPEHAEELFDLASLDEFVRDLLAIHPRFGAIGFWRVLMMAVVVLFDRHKEGNDQPAVQSLYDDIIDEMREF